MAETAPLTSAHAHARKAAEELEKVHWKDAADEHQFAAADFARAARGTSDGEALRILRLLEEEHQKLARILRGQEKTDASELIVQNSPAVEASSKLLLPDTAAEQPTNPPKAKSTTSALAAARFDGRNRDSSPSLAREIASRRGIPQQSRSQPSPSAQARARQLSPESRRSSRASTNLRIPPPITETLASSAEQSAKAKKQADDDAFAKFYTGLTTGTMSKLSSVLAFAGLPLTAEDPKSEPSRTSKQTVTASHEPDVKKIFSEAALNAIEDEHRQRGTFGRGFNPAESFYVVPPSGMTTSFAEMARKRAGEDDEDDFVDAREIIGLPSPKIDRSMQLARDAYGKARTHEELELENTTLKHMLEQLAVRLANFETHAQDASMAALTQSMVTLHQPNAAPTDAAMLERVHQLEQQIEKDAEERQKLQEENRKQARELKKWSAGYEKLVKSAKSKQKAKEAGGKDTDAPAGEASVGDKVST